MDVYVAFNSVPDYHAPPPTLRSIHATLDGAISALYPDREDFRKAFKDRRRGDGTEVWEGPDGFGSIVKMEVLP